MYKSSFFGHMKGGCCQSYWFYILFCTSMLLGVLSSPSMTLRKHNMVEKALVIGNGELVGSASYFCAFVCAVGVTSADCICDTKAPTRRPTARPTVIIFET